MRLPRSSKRRPVRRAAEELLSRTCRATALAASFSCTASNNPRVMIGLRMLPEMRQRDDFDIIHFHVDLLPQALFHDLAHKCTTTLHGRLDQPDILLLYESYPEIPLVSISNAQRLPMPANANWLATIPHGLTSPICPFDPEGGDYLAFLGRISPEKRPDRAIEIAKRAGVPLKIAAKVDDVDLAYFKAEIELLLDHPLIEFLDEINDSRSANSLARRGRYYFRSTGRSRSGW
jgi:glycosyltransferase involved in cell wall biosynthesis